MTVHLAPLFVFFRFLRLGHLALSLSVAALWGRLSPGVEAEAQYWAWLGRRVVRSLEKAGGALTKAGQIMSTRYDLFPAAFIEQLITLQDHTKPLDDGTMRPLLRYLLQGRLGERLASIDAAPIGSGSVAQVHRAIGIDGQPFALKIRRPGIEDRFRIDAAFLRLLFRGLSILPSFRTLPIVEAGDEICEMLTAQTNLLFEMQRHQAFSRHFAESEISVPRIVEELCSEGVLVMEHAPGLRSVLDEAVGIRAREAAAVACLRSVYSSVFLAGLVHCDLHPGNFYIGDGGKIVILDFGLSHVMHEASRRRFVEFFLSLALGDAESVCCIVKAMLQTAAPQQLEDSFNAKIGEIVRQSSGIAVKNFGITAFVLQLYSIIREARGRVRQEFLAPIWALLVCEGTLKRLCPDLDFQREALPFLLRS